MFTFAARHKIRMFERLIRHEGNVRTSHDNRHIIAAYSIGYLVGSIRRRRYRRDAHQIYAAKERIVKKLYFFKAYLGVPSALLHQRAEDKYAKTRQGEFGEYVFAGGFRLDE